MSAWAFVLRRARSQALLLAVVLVVVVAGTTLAGTCALLLTTAQQEALEASLERSAPDDVAVLASLVLEPGAGATPEGAGSAEDAAGTGEDAEAVLARALAPLEAATSTWWAAPMRSLPPTGTGDQRMGYLAGGDDLTDAATLVSGRWPAPATDTGAPREVAVPASTAAGLGLAAGSRVSLGAVPGALTGPVDELVVVGTFAPSPGDAAWTLDPLGGAGSSSAEDVPGTRGRRQLPAFGPFVVGDAGVPPAADVARLALVVRPDLDGAARLGAGDLDGVQAALGEATGDVRAALGERVAEVRVRSSLGATLADARGQLRVAGAQVVVLALVGTALSATALGLAGHLLAGRRAAEAALLTARGLGRARRLAQAGTEGLLLALAAAALALPLSLLAHRALARSPLLAAAGVDGDGGVTPALAAAVAAAGLVLAAALVAPQLLASDQPVRARGPGRGALARSGVDLLLLGVAAAAYLQLRDRPPAPPAGGAGIDPVLVVAPVLCLLAGAALVLRVVPVALRRGERRAQRSRGLVVPLAAWELARRPRASGAAFLLVLATAAATSGAASTATWLASQQDQADTAVGTGLSVEPAQAAPLAVGGALAAATGGVVVPVTTRPVALGSRVGAGSDVAAPQLLALDTARTEQLVRGRPPEGGTWADAAAGLAPGAPVGGVPAEAVDGSVPLVLTGSVRGGVVSLLAAPTLLLQDAHGDRAALPAPTVPLDGRPHRVELPVGPAGEAPAPDALRVVGLALRLSLDPAVHGPDERLPSAPVTVRAELPTGADGPDAPPAPDAAGGWVASVPGDDDEQLLQPAVESGGPGVTATTTVVPELLAGVGATLLVTAFEPPAEVPVAVTADLADDVGAVPGDQLDVRVDAATVVARVVRVVPHLPSLPRGPALLADSDALSRALVARGELASTTDRWWVGDLDDPQGAGARVEELGLGEATTAAGLTAEWQDGPLRSGLRAALWVLVAAACALALAGAALHATAALAGRAVEVARLQALGVPRRSVLAALLLQHGALVVLTTAAGAALGAVLARAVAPLVVVSATGLAPVPAAVPRWPWPQEAGLLALLLLGCTAVAVPVATWLVRRAGAAHLRLDAGP